MRACHRNSPDGGTAREEQVNDMELVKFYGLNIGIVASVGLVIVVYLIVLINKRRRSKFLHGNHRQI
jgi:hypothetical protein